VLKKSTFIGALISWLMMSFIHFSAAADFPISDASKTSFISVTDSGASQNRIAGGFTSILPKCEASQTFWCIKSLEVDFGDGKYTEAKFVRYVKNLSGSETPPVNSTITKSAISIWATIDRDGSEKTFAVHSVLSASLFSSSIYAFKEIKSRVRDDKYDQMSYPSADYRLTNPGYIDDCVFVAEGKCAQRNSFNGAHFRLSQYVSTEYSTWFAGRIKEARVTVNKVVGGQSELVISGGGLKVPHVLLEVPGVDRFVASGCNDIEEYAKRFPSIDRVTLNAICGSEKSKYDKCFPINTWESGSYSREACSYSTSMSSSNFSVTPFVNNVNLFKPYLQSIAKSSFEPEIWSVQSSSQSSKSTCLDTGGYIGMLNTNALVYDAYPPKIYDDELTYRVASPHMSSKNETNLGVFDLQMNTKVMKCLYNFSDAPFQVTISVVDENGEKQIATSSWSESNEVLRVSLTGFHFSAPEIKMKFSQLDLPSVPVVEKVKIKKTITCIKGKVIKKVTSISPKCPAGYKKK